MIFPTFSRVFSLARIFGRRGEYPEVELVEAHEAEREAT
jgi:hypothetical protein